MNFYFRSEYHKPSENLNVRKFLNKRRFIFWKKIHASKQSIRIKIIHHDNSTTTFVT